MNRRSFFTKVFAGVLAGAGAVLCKPMLKPIEPYRYPFYLSGGSGLYSEGVTVETNDG